MSDLSRSPRSHGRLGLLVAGALWLATAQPAAALVYSYDNTTSGTLSNAATPCTNPLVRTFTVTDSFTVSSIALGLNLSHNNRGDIRGTLVAPGGTSFLFLNNSGDTDNDYDVTFSTNTEGALDDNDADVTAEPHYNRLVSVAGMNFYTGNSAGTWTLQLCDNVGGTDGTFNRARLVLQSSAAAAQVCTSTVSYDWGSNGNSAAFTSATVSGITISQGAMADHGLTVTADGFNTMTGTSGNHTGYYRLSMDASAVPGTQDNESVGLSATLNLSPAVRDLTFTLVDVDITGNAWEDQIFVLGFDSNGNLVPYSRTFLGAAAQQAGNMAEGDAAAGTTDITGNITYRYEGAVASVQLVYSQGSDPVIENNLMLIGISDFISCTFDYGDAPNTYGTQLSGGARHVVGDRSLYLGTNPPDGESDGQPGAAATTDDTTTVGGTDDEDGVSSFPNYVHPSTSYTVSVTAVNGSTSTAASLVGYIDWNRDGDFADANERSVTTNVPANTSSPTAFNVTWTSVPFNAGGTTATYARFRIAYVASQAESPTGEAASGEVEDYPLAEGILPVTLASFFAQRTERGIEVEWTTETETATVGYRVLGDGSGAWASLGGGLVPTAAIDSLAPQAYRVVLPDDGSRTLGLEDSSTTGVTTFHGPFELGRLYGRKPEPREIDWKAVAAEARAHAVSETLALRDLVATSPAGTFPAAELRLDQAGIYRVTYEQLAAAGVDLAGAPLDRLDLERPRNARKVPLFVQAGTGTPGFFGPGGFIEFRGLPIEDSLYTRTRVYRLSVATKPALAVNLLPGNPVGATLASYTEKLAIERDLAYSFASPNGDPWYEAPVLSQGAPAERTFPFQVENLAGTQAKLTVDLWGVTDWPGDSPDHNVTLLVNGQVLAKQRFDGLAARSFQLDLPAGLLTEGTNELTVRVPGDTGYSFDLVHVDGYTLSYPRSFVARQDRLTFPALLPSGRGSAATPGRIAVGGLSSPEAIVYVHSGATRLTGVAVESDGGGWRAAFTVPRAGSSATSVEGDVYVTTREALLTPQISPVRVPPADLEKGNATYLVVAHPQFVDAIAPLVAAREAQGLTVKVVDVRDLYAGYTGGEVDPAAIRRYVKVAARRLGTRFLLLVGGDTYDYLDHLGIGSLSFVPTLYAQSDDLIRFTPADSLFGDTDDDGVQDLAVGRLPARTTAELDLLIAKTLAYPSTPAQALFAADGTLDRYFSTVSDAAASLLPGSWGRTHAYVDDLGLAGARAQLLSAFDQGPALVSFVGHSGPTVWSFSGLFSTADADALANFGQPATVVQWGCWNTYHVSPQYDTLAHRLLLAGTQGAAAVVGSSTLSKATSDQLIGPQLLTRLMEPGRTLGEALVLAKQFVAPQAGDRRDVLLGWTLLGDPALVVNP
ncbi:MAG TPA: C25 family cysteine peptidase [Thermoanaerobaculia bacterium]|nr:C25 family cysteine peptidase [Thermoanaerobaculia bacterium]